MITPSQDSQGMLPTAHARGAGSGRQHCMNSRNLRDKPAIAVPVMGDIAAKGRRLIEPGQRECLPARLSGALWTLPQLGHRKWITVAQIEDKRKS
jgi:hypothetical protein